MFHKNYADTLLGIRFASQHWQKRLTKGRANTLSKKVTSSGD